MKITSILVFIASALLLHAEAQPQFQSARPVWPKGRELEKNLFVGFRATFKAPKNEKIILRIAGATSK